MKKDAKNVMVRFLIKTCERRKRHCSNGFCRICKFIEMQGVVILVIFGGCSIVGKPLCYHASDPGSISRGGYTNRLPTGYTNRLATPSRL